jgi:signal transduction histidine kinase/CheY-like chemotaxis protein
MESNRQQKAPRRDRRILVLAPTGRDGNLAAEVLGAHGFTAQRCADAAELAIEGRKGGGAILIAGEALSPEGRRPILELLRTQPYWSEMPVIVLARHGEDLATLHAAFDSQCNMTFLERPVQIGTMVSAVQAALRARQRQYEVRDLVEQLRDTDRRKDEFLAMLGHELRNPLGVIRTALELLRNCDSESSPRQVNRIEHQIAHLSRMVDDLLDLSRVSRGRIILQRRACELGHLAASAIEACAAARGRVIELQRPSEALWVDGDPVRLEQVVTNLVNNALKYAPAETPIVVSLAREASSAVLRVKDEGIGIHPDELERIFDTFTQLSTSLARSGGGLGLGLSLVRHLVRLHGGQVMAASDGPGKGSEFSVRLPLLPADRVPAETPAGAPGALLDEAARTAAESAPGAGNGHSTSDGHLPVASEPAPLPRLLVVEDLEDAREALGELLALYGYEVDLAADGVAGVEQALRQAPDIALIDIGLPGLDGYQVARRLREHLGGAVFLVAMTGYGQAEDRRRAREAGFDHHLVKPVSPDRLLDLLRQPRPTLGRRPGGPTQATQG